MDQNKPAVVLNSEDHEKLQTKKNRRKPDARDAMLALDRSRWAFLSFFLIIALMFSAYYVYTLSSKVQDNFELIYIKIFPDGSHQVATISPNDPQLFFQTTVEKHLREYIEYRWGLTPPTVKTDYGRALYFMSPYIAGIFNDPEQFDAAGKASAALTSTDPDYISIEFRAFDYYDTEIAEINRQEQKVFKTNVYITRIYRDEAGKEKHREKDIVALEWRLMPKKELLTLDADFFRINAIGLEIMGQKLFEDLSADKTPEEATKEEKKNQPESY